MSFLKEQKGVVAASLIFVACLLAFSIVSRQSCPLYGNKKSFDLWTPGRRLQSYHDEDNKISQEFLNTNQSIIQNVASDDFLNSEEHNFKTGESNLVQLPHSAEQEIKSNQQIDIETSKTTVEMKFATDHQVKLIYGHEAGNRSYSYWRKWSEVTDLTQCEYTNCRLTTDGKDIKNSDIVILTKKHLDENPHILKSLYQKNRWKQYWVFNSKESSAYNFNHFKPSWNKYFNITATYRTGSTVVTHDYQPVLTKRQKTLKMRDYSVGKTYDMVAYVSNCESVGYDRLSLMNAVANGSSIGYNFTFDLYGGCGVKPPCEREHPAYHRGFNSHLSAENNCTKFNSRYRFFLSFKNSLCTDYITEKFWSVLKSEDFMIPVVMGGMSIKDYLYIAPPNSFIHVENFTSIMQLQKHLVLLIEDPAAFNRYHTWREDIELEHNDLPNACELCRIANERPNLPADKDWARWWNKPQNCRSVDAPF